MAIDYSIWGTVMGVLDSVAADAPGTDPEDLATLRDALEACLDAVQAEITANLP
ncbi:hypothetical protein AB0H58_32375 [Nocardia neocaledoniensis]|uniref:hypothetical protein n=1 Tax=Nocardia neocaledoniensis TaxID=236511 RepID=UPI0033F1A3C8